MSNATAERLLSLADAIRDSAVLTQADMDSADKHLWAAYEAGAFSGDDLFTWLVNEQRGYCDGSAGFAELLLLKWLPVRVPGRLRFDDADPKQACEHGIRQIARMMLAAGGPVETLRPPAEASARTRITREEANVRAREALQVPENRTVK